LRGVKAENRVGRVSTLRGRNVKISGKKLRAPEFFAPFNLLFLEVKNKCKNQMNKNPAVFPAGPLAPLQVCPVCAMLITPPDCASGGRTTTGLPPPLSGLKDANTPGLFFFMY